MDCLLVALLIGLVVFLTSRRRPTPERYMIVPVESEESGCGPQFLLIALAVLLVLALVH